MEVFIVLVIIGVIIHHKWTRPNLRGRARIQINRKRGW
jgi:hypothetical protein